MAVTNRDDLHVGDEGTIIRLQLNDDGVVVDVSTSDVLQIKFRKPDSTTVTKDATKTTDGSDGLIQYITETDVDNILDTPGVWEMQGYVEMPGAGKWHSEKKEFIVRDNIA